MKKREQMLFDLAKKNKEDSGRKTIREKNELKPLVDEDHHIDPDLENVSFRKFTVRDFLAKLDSNSFKLDDFDQLFPGKEFTQKERALG